MPDPQKENGRLVLRDWTVNDMALDYIRERLRGSKLHGQVVFHVRDGVIMKTEVNEIIPRKYLTGEEEEP